MTVNEEVAETLKEQFAMERAARDQKMAKLVQVARENPDMPICLLAERFGLSDSAVLSVLRVHKVYREHDLLSHASQRRTKRKTTH